MGFFDQKNLKVMMAADQVAERVAALGEQITRDYGAKLGADELVCIGILKGSFMFLADLVRRIDLPVTVDFIALSSYGDATESSGVVQLTQDLSRPIAGKHVLVVEDIVDTGLTMKYLLENLHTRHPASIRLASLLEKPTKNQAGVKVDYLGFAIEDKFVVGYGLDAASRYRNLPYIGVITS
ncbi:MAG: hypoxanthine phosphoribosyltransferase [Deltaproteobacteria bacterium RBG_16_71_12]|nr:MAG: hypoxanthine phosphoribosyltransferase [Deltaproteobacteria bacterium RBG_16_71_12]